MTGLNICTIAMSMIGITIASAPLMAQSSSSVENEGWSILKDSQTKAFDTGKDGYHHRLSGFYCPNSMFGVKLAERKQYWQQGQSVGCRYAVPNAANIQFSIENSNQPIPANYFIRGKTEQFEKDFPKLKKISSGPQKMRIGRLEVDCETAAFTRGSKNQINENIWSCSGNGFNLKVSATATAEAGDLRSGITNFLVAQTDFSDHHQSCQTTMKDIANASPSKRTGLYVNAANFDFKLAGRQCYAGAIKGDGNRYLISYWPDNPDTPVTVQLFDNSGNTAATPLYRVQDMFAGVPAEQRKEEAGFLLISQDESVRTVFSGYARIPMPGSIFGDVKKVEMGELKPRMTSQLAPTAASNYSAPK